MGHLGRALRSADRLVTAAAVPIGAAGAYVGVLSLLARPGRVPDPDGSVRFAIVVPAHNEELGIADTVKSLLSLDYPAEQVRVLVVADNCTDLTATRAREAGAEVIVRDDRSQRGKGYALAYAFDRLLAEPHPVHAVVVVDADTRVSPNLLRAFSGRLAGGASAMQASYRVANPGTTWRTTLMSVAFTCMHDLRSLGRERLRLSTGLRGNGMCFSTDSLRAVPHRAASLVEDVEHGIDLARHGIRVVFVHEASVEAEMPERDDNAASQRERWERGRARLRRQRAPRLLLEAVRRGDPVRADLALDLLLPPLAQYVVALGATGAAALAVSTGRRRWSPSVVPVALGAVGLVTHVAEGWRRSGTGTDGLRALLKVPTYVIWKLGLRRGAAANSGLGPAGADAEEWVRTTRNAELKDA